MSGILLQTLARNPLNTKINHLWKNGSLYWSVATQQRAPFLKVLRILHTTQNCWVHSLAPGVFKIDTNLGKFEKITTFWTRAAKRAPSEKSNWLRYSEHVVSNILNRSFLLKSHEVVYTELTIQQIIFCPTPSQHSKKYKYITLFWFKNVTNHPYTSTEKSISEIVYFCDLVKCSNNIVFWKQKI